MPVLSSWLFHNDLQAQTALTPTRIPHCSVVKSGLERETTNWAEIAKTFRDRRLSPSAPVHIKLVKENIK